MKHQRKPTQYERDLLAHWEKIMRNSAKPLEKGTGKPVSPPKRSEPLTLNLHFPEGRPSHHELPSRSTGGGSTARLEPQTYSGNAMLGIGQMHKSNAVPIFRSEDAVDLARMRRG
jgi:hypothetical protein